jgi:hypothetical protein
MLKFVLGLGVSMRVDSCQSAVVMGFYLPAATFQSIPLVRSVFNQEQVLPAAAACSASAQANLQPVLEVKHA